MKIIKVSFNFTPIFLFREFFFFSFSLFQIKYKNKYSCIVKKNNNNKNYLYFLNVFKINKLNIRSGGIDALMDITKRLWFFFFLLLNKKFTLKCNRDFTTASNKIFVTIESSMLLRFTYIKLNHCWSISLFMVGF
jgi:hypothetical protein